MGSILEKDVVMGTFTHRETHLPALIKSVRKNLPHITFMLQVADLPIVHNFNALREKFKESGKRFWLFLDDDIEFLFPDTIQVALETMIRNKYAVVGVYSTFDPECRPDPKTLTEREVHWVPGYFQLVDSQLVGYVKGDEKLPDPNTAIDTSYCVRIKQEGYRIGIAPTYVHHTFKQGCWINKDVIEPTNKYLMGKYGPQYFEWCNGLDNIIGGQPDFESTPLRKNRAKLIQWQSENYIAEAGKLKLHLGCGNLRYPGFVNCDLDGDTDLSYDITQRGPWPNGSVDHISCHHVLEHVSYRLFGHVLDEWKRILKLGGTVDIGMPDLDLVCQEFLDADETRRWNAILPIMYGQQGPTTKQPYELTDEDPIIQGQFHRGGLTLKRACELLTVRGFEILDAYNYDGNGTPSLFVLARKCQEQSGSLPDFGSAIERKTSKKVSKKPSKKSPQARKQRGGA